MAEAVVKAPMKALVMRFHVQKGSSVNAKDRVCDIEALKMEIPVMAPVAGTIKDIFASPGQEVQAGDPLFAVES